MNTLPDDESLPHVSKLMEADSAGQTTQKQEVKLSHRSLLNAFTSHFLVVFTSVSTPDKGVHHHREIQSNRKHGTTLYQ